MTDLLDGRNWQVLTGDALQVLRGLPDGCVQCCVTSPPYWGLRDYGTAEWEGGDPECSHEQESPRFNGPKQTTAQVSGHASAAERNDRKRCQKCGARRVDAQLGLEGTPEEYVARMVDVFRDVRRVLRDDGTLWLNLGDSYLAAQGGRQSAAGLMPVEGGSQVDSAPWNGQRGYTSKVLTSRNVGLKPKDLCGIPWRVAFALQADGWYLRSDIVWAKANPMPESVTDRPTKAHEYVFLLTKQPRYYYDADAIREPHSRDWTNAGGSLFNAPRYAENALEKGAAGEHRGDGPPQMNPAGRNRRTVWTIATQPFPEAHFATYPPALVEPCILAGSSDRACSVCGAAWVRQVERKTATPGQKPGYTRDCTMRSDGERAGSFTDHSVETTGFAPGCDCGADTCGSLVLDPFCGSGTTGAVAVRLGRRFLGIELNPEYVAMSERRIGKAERTRQPALFDAMEVMP